MTDIVASGDDEPDIVVACDDGSALQGTPAIITVIVEDKIFCRYQAIITIEKDAENKNHLVVKFIEISGTFNETVQ